MCLTYLLLECFFSYRYRKIHGNGTKRNETKRNDTLDYCASGTQVISPKFNQRKQSCPLDYLDLLLPTILPTCFAQGSRGYCTVADGLQAAN